MTAILAMSIISMILLTVIALAVAVMSRQASTDAFRTLDAITARFAEQQNLLLDRFQAIKWEDLAALRSTQDGEDEGGFFPPIPPRVEEEGEMGIEEPGAWGRLRRLSKQTEEEENEQQLLVEDFPQ